MTPMERRKAALKEQIRIEAHDHMMAAEDAIKDVTKSDSSARCEAAIHIGAALALLSFSSEVE